MDIDSFSKLINACHFGVYDDLYIEACTDSPVDKELELELLEELRELGENRTEMCTGGCVSSIDDLD
jgi:hypothetical protein